MQFARRWFSPATVSSVFEPLVADWQRQWSEAAPAQRRWVNVQGRVAFAATTAMITPRLAFAPIAFLARPLMSAGCFWFVTSALLTIPFVLEDLPLKFLWLLLPASLTLMLPFAILPAIDAMRNNGEEPTLVERRTALTFVAIAVLGVVVGQGWLTPVANQQWRNQTMTALTGRPSVASRGVREVTTSELIAGDVAITSALSGTPRVRELNLRLSLALLPAVLGWLRWQSLSPLRRRSWALVKSCLLALGATAAFIAVMAVGPGLERLFLAPGFGPSLALALFALTTRTGLWLRQRAEWRDRRGQAR